MSSTRCCHVWDKMRFRCERCGKRKTRHYLWEKQELSCGCIYSYRPGPEGWQIYAPCQKHAKLFREATKVAGRKSIDQMKRADLRRFLKKLV